MDLLGTADDAVLPTPPVTASNNNQKPNNQDLLDLLGLDLSTPEPVTSTPTTTIPPLSALASTTSLASTTPAFTTLPPLQPPILSSPLDALGGFSSSNGSDFLVNSILSQSQNSSTSMFSSVPPPLLATPTSSAAATTSTTTEPIVPASNSLIFDDLTNFNQVEVSLFYLKTIFFISDNSCMF